MPTDESDFILNVFDLVDQMQDIEDKDAIRNRMLTLLGNLGIKYFVAARLPQPRLRLAPNTMLRVWRHDWLTHYDARGYFRQDPVVERCTGSVDPFLWSDVRTEPGTPGARVMAEASEHGMACGMSIPIHDAHGMVGGVSIAGEKLDVSPKIFNAIYLLGLMFYSTAERVSGPRQACARLLSPREREVLSWYGSGCSAGEIGTRLGIAEGTVVVHARSARGKLNTRTTTHAVVEAIRHGEIKL